MTVPEAQGCPVCHDPAGWFLTADGKHYFRCPTCAARFVDRAARPEPTAEHAHYLHHENDPGDPRYRAFLSRLADPLLEVLPARAEGLDYGCGPGPALAAMLTEAGHRMEVWDPFFAADPAALDRTYDFITCTEVAEHFHDPAAEFARLRAILRPGGVLGVMTCFQTDDARFEAWHYRKDPTHVVFYKEDTFCWISDKFGWTVRFPRKDVAILSSPGTGR
ncbi:MAG: class I SAM-dependent methyltransferase [Pseudomonadota bacterium]